jgi:hypothetical protein
MNNGEELIRVSPSRTLTPIMNITLAKSRLAEFQQFVKEYMVEGEDYGQIPGTQKPTLYKPGADKLCELYGLSDSYRILNRLVDFDSGLFDYEIECTLSKDGFPFATGLGCCSSFEGKYRWRDSKRICPQCGKDTIIKGKEEFGGGWLCFKKSGGCGAKFAEDDESITNQVIGRVENDDLATIKNTVFKIAKKRAKIDGVLSATRSAGQFTQDIGDDEGHKKPKAEPIQQPQRKSETAKSNGNGPVCSKCKNPMRFAEKGVTKTGKNAGKDHEAYWKCFTQGCDSFMWDKDYQAQRGNPEYSDHEPEPQFDRDPGMEG